LADKKGLGEMVQQKWHPKGHIELKMGAKGFSTMIFTNMEDKKKVF